MSELAKKLSVISQRLVGIGTLLVLLLMPFHAFISVYLGYLGADRSIVQSWKEVVILSMAFLWLIYQATKKRLAFELDSTNVLFGLVVMFSLLITLFVRPNSEALLFGIKTNLVAIALYFIAQTPLAKHSILKTKLFWIVVVPGVIVSLLAIMQSFFIAPEFLSNFGYNSSTISPKQIIDGSISFFRAFSTLGGPNQLGAYLVVPLVFVLVYGIRNKRWWLLVCGLPIVAGIVLSFSRSAWIGAIIGVLVAIFVAIDKKWRLYFAIASITFICLASVLVATQINSNTAIENVLLHGRYFENRIEGSDKGRLESLVATSTKIINSPFGHGLGSAGPSSFKADEPVIPENWYLQIAYEIGLPGLLLYILAFASLTRDFVRSKSDLLAISLLAATLAVLVMNLFLQTWAD
ncbi:hypothetical protein EXS53_01945, partial [Patescibacteria group bacterium]|nr:hypothetical protein [Patescibacteria group bacterium]